LAPALRRVADLMLEHRMKEKGTMLGPAEKGEKE